MVPSVKLAIVSKSGAEALLLGKLACISSSSLHSSRKKPYLVSASSYQLSVKSILFFMYIRFQWYIQKSKWWIVTKHDISVIFDNQIIWSSLFCKEWVLCITNLSISKEACYINFCFVYKIANILWYAISPKFVICHNTHILLST